MEYLRVFMLEKKASKLVDVLCTFDDKVNSFFDSCNSIIAPYKMDDLKPIKIHKLFIKVDEKVSNSDWKSAKLEAERKLQELESKSGDLIFKKEGIRKIIF